MDNVECSNRYRYETEKINNNKICAAAPGKDACQVKLRTGKQKARQIIILWNGLGY